MTDMDGHSIDNVSILGVKVSRLTVTSLLEIIADTIDSGGRATLLTVNVNGMNLACDQPWFRAVYNQSDFVICDGFGVKWGARLLGRPLPARLTPPDWLFGLAELALQRNYAVAFVGNKPGVGERVVERLKERYPRLRALAIYHGYFEKTLGCPESEHVIRLINLAQPNILFVGFGMPWEQKWLLENWNRLNVNIAVTVGAMPDFVAGVTRRGPQWMTDHGLEWLARLATEPRRLWRRYLVGNPLFIARIISQRLGIRHYD